MSRKIKILIIDDEDKITSRLKSHFEKQNYEVETANTVNESFVILSTFLPELVLLDVMLPGMSGMDVLKTIKAQYPSMEVILMSGYGDMDMVIQSMRQGACDFIRKPFQVMDVQLAVERTTKFIEVQSKLNKSESQRALISRDLDQLIGKEFIGDASSIRKVLDLALKAASDPDVSVLITGENGTGKEVLARIIHLGSERVNNAFATVNCAAIPDTLMESEFFGHVKGAFTDAKDSKLGYFELAHEGTLFLDEIGDMPLLMQSKLLRALEQRKIKKLGDTKEIQVNIRLISATNQNLEKMMTDGKFRDDLFHRINTIEINIPPLRERTEDIELLLNHFVENLSARKGIQAPAISELVISKLNGYYFPGNVRELRNMVERALILSSNNCLMPDDFPIKANPNHGETIVKSNPHQTLDELEKEMLQNALTQTGFNQTQAADLLGISRDAVKRRIKKYNIHISHHIQEDEAD